MGNETTPETLKIDFDPERLAYVGSQFIDGKPTQGTEYTRTDTISEIRRQNAALKEFVNFILFINSGESKVIDKGRELSIIVGKIATEKDIELGLENDIRDEVISVADWMLTDTAAMPAPSKAEVARELRTLFSRKFPFDDDIDYHDVMTTLKEWEDAERDKALAALSADRQQMEANEVNDVGSK